MKPWPVAASVPFNVSVNSYSMALYKVDGRGDRFTGHVTSDSNTTLCWPSSTTHLTGSSLQSPTETLVVEKEHDETHLEQGKIEAGVDTNTVERPTPATIHGWRLWLTIIGVMLLTILVNLEISIVGTSLVSIANDLDGLDRASWIVTGYLATYTGFMIIWSKLSDILGRKSVMLVSLGIFVAFSAGCGASMSMTQLIICRVFQGLGAAGCYSLAVVVMLEAGGRARYPAFSALAVIMVAIANLLGPILGGVINDAGAWRWVFLLNAPVGALTLALLALAIPSGFPYHLNPRERERKRTATVFATKLKMVLANVDFPGAIVLLAATILLITTLLEASIQFGWNSGATIAMLVISACCWIGFLVWERHLTRKGGDRAPVFPWRFFANITWVGMLLASFVVGVPFNVLIIALPQRFQTIDDASPLRAGVQLLPYTVILPVCSFISNMLAAKGKIPFFYLLSVGAVMQLIGTVLLSTLDQSLPFSAAAYVYEALIGASFGFLFSVLLLAVPYLVEPRDIAVGTGAIMQVRYLGGAIGLSITSSYMNSHLKSSLAESVPPHDLQRLLQDSTVAKELSAATQAQVKQAFADGYDTQFRILVGFAVATALAVVLTRRRNHYRCG